MTTRHFASACLVATLFPACASTPRLATDLPPRHYRGAVLDARTGTPVAGVSVTAYHQPLTVPYLVPPAYLGFTLTRADGTFDLSVPADRPSANHLEAAAYLPLTDPTHPHRGELTGYHGVLNHASVRRPNTIRVRRLSTH